MVEFARIVDIAIFSRIVAQVVSNAQAIKSATMIYLKWRTHRHFVRFLLLEECSSDRLGTRQVFALDAS